jgi:hypothetical protein
MYWQRVASQRGQVVQESVLIGLVDGIHRLGIGLNKSAKFSQVS